jgi:anti-anti-sigma factor
VHRPALAAPGTVHYTARMPESAYVSAQTAGNAVVARLEQPKLGEFEAAAVVSDLLACARDHQWRLAVDLTNVLLLASAGLGTLLTVNKSCVAGGGRMALFGVNDDLMGVLRMTNLHKILHIGRDRDAALKALA